uniref:HAP2-GCS1 domain-containing protein n=1 Tax=Rhodnius prolixus TaxID=13249 RepID=T1HSQ3_RHOPR
MFGLDCIIKTKYLGYIGGPEEYLLVRSEDITYDGDDCDKAGVGFKAFAKQPARCDNLRGTCLANQPAHLWKQDIEARRSGRPGKYFLENYAKVSEDPIKFHKEVGDFLSLDFSGPYQSVVEVEVPIDRNGLVRAESTAQLSEIYIDATCEHQTRITILVTNNGLTSSAFYPRMKGCPPEIPMVWTENEGPLVYIAPQKIHKYRLSLYGKLPATRFHCSIELMNKKKELVATRRIRVQHYDRCICMWHCLCACIGSISGLKCEHMSLEHYHAAGFFGAMPIDTEDPAYERGDAGFSPFVLKDFLIYVGYVYATFIIMGLLKFLIGLFFVTVANYGMWLLFECEAKNMDNYKESYWAFTHLVRDSQSFPISPAGRSRQIQILPNLCRRKKKIESRESKEQQLVKGNKKCKVHIRVKESASEVDRPHTVQYFEYMASTKHGNNDEDKLLLPSEKNPLRKDCKMSNKIPFSVDDVLPNNYEDMIANVSYIVKASDYPNVRSVIKEVEEMKNKMIKNVVSNVSKAAIQKILKNKNGMKENSGHEKSAVKPIAEQVVVLIDRCFKEIIKRKSGEARLAKLYDGDIKPMDNLIANNTFDQNLQFQSGNKNRYFSKT